MRGRGFDSGATLDALDAGIAGISPDWRCIYWNASAERLTGIDRTDVIGANVWDRFAVLRDTELGRAMREAMERREPGELKGWRCPPGQLSRAAEGSVLDVRC